LKKIKNKKSERFGAHCVDAWVLAADESGAMVPDNVKLFVVKLFRFHRRQLHYLSAKRGGIRTMYGGTRSGEFKRGSLVHHRKYGLVYVGGISRRGLALHDIRSAKRLCQNAKREDCKFKSFLNWRGWLASA
jgi:hypothetical protein